MFETVVTYLIVAGAVAYACWRLLPESLCQLVTSGITTLTRRRGLAADALPTPVQQSVRRNQGCGSCRGCSPPPAAKHHQMVVNKHSVNP